MYNVPNGKLKQVTSCGPQVQLTGVTIKSKVLELQGIEYIDDTWSKFRGFYDRLLIADLPA